MRRRGVGVLVIVSLAWLGVACSEDDQGPGQSPLDIEKPATKSGDRQNGPVSTALGNPLRVLITRDGEPVEEVDVEWSAGQGGSLSAEQSSNAEGIASVVWTLGPDVGEQTATAAIQGADGSPLTYTATATIGGPPPEGPIIRVLGPDGGNRFDPELLTITPGQTVTWVWPEGSLDHNVAPEDGNNPSASGPVTDGPETHSFTFTVPGSYRYFCMTHGAPGGIGMSGRVIVQTAQP
jgi:plastocyanin